MKIGIVGGACMCAMLACETIQKGRLLLRDVPDAPKFPHDYYKAGKKAEDPNVAAKAFRSITNDGPLGCYAQANLSNSP